MAFLDDVYVTTLPDRVATVEQSVEIQLWDHPGESRQDSTGVENGLLIANICFTKLMAHRTMCGEETQDCPVTSKGSQFSGLLFRSCRIR